MGLTFDHVEMTPLLPDACGLEGLDHMLVAYLILCRPLLVLDAAVSFLTLDE